MTSTDQAARPVEMFAEAGRKWVFASALDWPGWCRSARTEELAIEALASYLPRYAPVARRAGLAVPAGELIVVGRAPGISAMADFGALGAIAPAEYGPLTAADGGRLAALLEAAWQELAEAAAAAPAVLPKGPRGGGRDAGPIIAHVVATEVMHASKLGLRPGKVTPADDEAVADLRAAITAALGMGSEGTPADSRRWPPRYVARRTGWHALDHAWELRDKS